MSQYDCQFCTPASCNFSYHISNFTNEKDFAKIMVDTELYMYMYMYVDMIL